MKNSILYFNKLLGTWFKTIAPGKNAVKGAAFSLLLFTAIIWILLAISFYFSVRDPWSFMLYLTVVIVAIICSLFLIFIIKLFHEIPLIYKLILFTSFPLLFISFSFDLYIIIYFIIIASLIGASIGVLRKTGFVNLTVLSRIITIAGMILGIGGMATLIILYVLSGFKIKIPENAALKSNAKIEQIQASSPGEKGVHEVKTLTYGSGKDKHRPEFGEDVGIKTDSVDAIPLIDNWRGFGGWARTKYWGIDIHSLPLNARVWYPEGNGPFPLVLVVHGNHYMRDYSDSGYDYLCELLASRGFILASVDENFINGSWSNVLGWLKNENDARAWLLLEHLKLWHQWNDVPGHIFFNKIDTDKISLIGHSRGGEAVAHAALFNTLPFFPDDALLRFDYNFKIQSIVAIAPSDGLYKPAKSKTTLENVSYLVLQGAQDADVTSYMGYQQYERISFNDSLYRFKSGLYIYGANHGQFNSSWGNNDIPSPFTGLLNLKQLLPEKEQQQIAKVYISAFLEATLNNKEVYMPLFADARTGSNWLPETIYLNQFEDSKTKTLCDYDDDFDLSSIGKLKDAISGENLSIWREQLVEFKSGNTGNRAVCLGWNDNDSLMAVYSLNLDTIDLDLSLSSVLCFTMADTENDPDPRSKGKWVSDEERRPLHHHHHHQKEKKQESIDFTIQLVDDYDQVLSFPLSRFSYLQTKIETKLMKMDFIEDDEEEDVVFQIFMYPLADILKINPEFSYNDIDKISFIFDRSKKGVVIIDKIGFMENLRTI